MRLGIFAKTYSGTDPVTVLTQARRAGYDCAQYNMACSGLSAMPGVLTAAQARDVAKGAQASGVAISAVSGTYNMIHPDVSVREQGMRRLGGLIAAAGAMGAPMVTLCTGTRDADDQWCWHPDNASAAAWRDLLEEMGRACVLAEAHGVRLGVEPELANVVCDAGCARALIDTLQSPALAIVLDPANLFEVAPLARQRDVIAQAVDVLGDRILMAHAKDRDASGAFVAAGKGLVDFPHFIGCLRAVGFDGDLITHGLTAEESPGVAAFLRGLL